MAARLSSRPLEDWPTSREALTEWALSRVEVHFDRCWEAAVEDWQSTQNRAGSLEDIEPEECIEMIHEGIKMHLDEVEKCMAANGGPRLESWRKGEARDEIPSPDGFSKMEFSAPLCSDTRKRYLV